ncbi:MAG: ATP-binding protein [Planctomycetota bacterium]
MPRTANVLASPFKELHARLLHLTWQAERIAEGDYHQRIDFMGTFSAAFNSMVEKLADREESLERAKDLLEEKVCERTAELTTINEQIRRDSQLQTVINELLSLSLRNLSLEEILGQAFDLIVNTPYLQLQSKGGIFLVEDDAEVLVMKVHSALPEQVKVMCSQVPFGTCLCGMAASTRQLQFAECVDDRHERKYDGISEHGHYCVPIISSQEVLGVITLYLEAGHIHSSIHEQFLQTAADVLSGIILRKKAEAELETAQRVLIDTAHRAGKAEVAADVLHNVGNVLNSINVSTTVIREKVTSSEVANLEKVANIINEHTDDLGTFLTEHPQGKHIPVYLTEVSKCLQNEQTDIISKLQVMAENVQHIKDIVSMQQSYAKVSGVEVQTSLSKLAEDAIQINSAGLERHGTRLIREFEELGDVEIDKQRTLQILVNLINNAKYALSDSSKEEKLLTIRIYKHCEDRFRIEVADNGVGISEDNLTKIFRHGFTTKEHGHGFGLHSSALAAKEMGGSLTVYSDGVGQGATFTLELPFKPIKVIK